MPRRRARRIGCEGGVMRRSFALVLALTALIGCNSVRGGSSDDPTIAAEVDGERISVGELDQRARERLWNQETNDGDASLVYELRDAELRAWIEEQALTREAKARGLDVPGLIAAELAARPVTDAEVAAFKEAHKAEIPPDAPVDQLDLQIRQHLQSQREQQIREEITGKAKVAVHLQPPRVQVSADGPSLGPADAPVTLIEFADFQCPYCARAVPIVHGVRERYPTQLRIVFKHLPLESIHPRARGAARAAICAEKQDKFWPYHDLLFQNSRALGEEELRSYAGTLGLDLTAFDACLASPELDARIAADVAEARAAGVSGTPAFVLNGVLLRGLRRVDDLSARIDRELAATATPD
jgi:protein-disulfide isomerase